MNTLKLYLITGLGMLVFALVCGVYVWYAVQSLDAEDGTAPLESSIVQPSVTQE